MSWMKMTQKRQPLFMPFGLSNASVDGSVFSKYSNVRHCLSGWHTYVQSNLGGTSLISGLFFVRLCENDLKLKLKKCRARVLKMWIYEVYNVGIILSRQRITEALIRLIRCAGWSAPLLFACGARHVLSWRDSILIVLPVMSWQGAVPSFSCCLCILSIRSATLLNMAI